MPPRPYPMGVGLDTDIETGEPLQVLQLDREAKRQEQRAQAIERHDRLVMDLAGPGGEMAKVIATRLAARIEELIQKDDEARTLANLLSSVEQQLLIGQRMAQEQLDKIISREGLDIIG